MNLKYIIFLFKSIRLIPKYFKQNKLTYKNIKNFIQGTNRLYNLKDQPQHIIEQLWFRLSKADSNCISNKKCPCNCELLGKQLSDEPCEKNCYPLMMDETTWTNYKAIFNLDMVQIEAFGKTIIEENLDLIP